MPALHIKGMVCSRCVLAVQQVLQRLHIDYLSVNMGTVQLLKELTAKQQETFHKEIATLGFEILDDKKLQVVEKVKTLLIALIQHQYNDIRIKYSSYLSQQLDLEYSYLSSLFTSVEHTTIEKYIIQLKIDKVKELLKYGELSLKEIAERLSYSSVQALSTQFKKVTAMSPTQFKEHNKFGVAAS